MPNKTLLSPREPMKSWIMELWLQNHEKREWPDLSICQQNALHVTDAKRHYTTKDIQSMCSVSFFERHNYKYVEKASASYSVDDEYYASCSSEGGSLDGRLGYHDRTDGRISATFCRDTGACRGAYEEPIVTTYCETSGEKKGIKSCQKAFTVPQNPKRQTETLFYESADLLFLNEPFLAPMHNESIGSRDTTTTTTRTSVPEKTDGFEKSVKTMPNDSSGYLSPLERDTDMKNLSKSLPVKERRSSSLFYSSTDVSPSTGSHSADFKGSIDDANPPIDGMGRIEAQPTSIANASNCSKPENVTYDDVPSTPIKLKNKALRDPCSVEKTKNTKRTKRNSPDSVHYSSVELVGSTLNCGNGNSSKAENSATYAGLHERYSLEYQGLISNPSNVKSHNSEADDDYDDVLGEDQTAMKSKDDHFVYEEVISFPVYGDEVVNRFNKKDDSLIVDYQNVAHRLEQKNITDNPQRDAKEDMNTAQYQNVKSLDHDDNSMDGKLQRNSLDRKRQRQCQNKIGVASGDVCPISTTMRQRAEHNSDPRESGKSMACPMNQEDDIMRFKLQRNTTSNEHSFINNYENFSCDLDQGDNSNSMRRNTERREGYNKYVDCETETQFSSNQSNARNCSYGNATYYLATPSSQLSKGARKITSGSQAKTKSKSRQKRNKEKTGADRISAEQDMHSTSERPIQNQSLMVQLNDPYLNVIQF